MDILLNAGAQKAFDSRSIEGIVPDDSYPVWTKNDPFGRTYFGVGNFCGTDMAIKEDTDLSWMEWEGNEVFLSDEDSQVLFERAVGIIKGWRDQLVKDFQEEKGVSYLFIAHDPNENTDYDQPVIKWNNQATGMTVESVADLVMNGIE